MDGGAWKAAVHGVAESRTRLSDFTFTFHFHALEKEMATHSSVLAWRIPGTGEPSGLPHVYGVAQNQTRLKQLSSSSKASIRTRSNFCNAIFSFLGNYYQENRTSDGNFSDSYQNNFVSSSLIDGFSYRSSNFLKLFSESENYTSSFSNDILQIKLKSQIGKILFF